MVGIRVGSDLSSNFEPLHPSPSADTNSNSEHLSHKPPKSLLSSGPSGARLELAGTDEDHTAYITHEQVLTLDPIIFIRTLNPIILILTLSNAYNLYHQKYLYPSNIHQISVKYPSNSREITVNESSNNPK